MDVLRSVFQSPITFLTTCVQSRKRASFLQPPSYPQARLEHDATSIAPSSDTASNTGMTQAALDGSWLPEKVQKTKIEWRYVALIRGDQVDRIECPYVDHWGHTNVYDRAYAVIIDGRIDWRINWRACWEALKPGGLVRILRCQKPEETNDMEGKLLAVGFEVISMTNKPLEDHPDYFKAFRESGVVPGCEHMVMNAITARKAACRKEEAGATDAAARREST